MIRVSPTNCMCRLSGERRPGRSQMHAMAPATNIQAKLRYNSIISLVSQRAMDQFTCGESQAFEANSGTHRSRAIHCSQSFLTCYFVYRSIYPHFRFDTRTILKSIYHSRSGHSSLGICDNRLFPETARSLPADIPQTLHMFEVTFVSIPHLPNELRRPLNSHQDAMEHPPRVGGAQFLFFSFHPRQR